MDLFDSRSPTAIYLRAFLGVHAARLRQAHSERDRGASAIELAIITAVLVGLAIVVLTVIIKEVNAGKQNITKTIPAP
jgi:Flp pilus assembly protein TadG